MAAYGLYTHIAANKTRSMVLLAGLFLLVYVIVYAGALIIEVLNNGDATFNYYLMAALTDVIRTLPWSTGAAAALDCHRLFLPPEDGRRHHRRRGRDAARAAAAL